LLECEDAPDLIDAGDIVEVDLDSGRIRNVRNGKTFTAKPYPDFMAGLISAGGLIEYTRRRLGVR
jgi:3-isopropylmalate/(R)-2-methylmalate dehydratase small subunit